MRAGRLSWRRSCPLLVAALACSGGWGAAACSSFDAAPDGNDASSGADSDAGVVVPSSRCDPRTPFSAPEPLDSVNSGGLNTLGARLTRDELTLYFSSDARGVAVGSLDLWVAKRGARATAFEAPTLLRDVSSIDSDDYPTVSNDGNELYFSRAAGTNVGTYDIWFARRDTRGSFSSPSPLVRTGNAEAQPFVTSNGDLYYASKGTVGRSFEIYRMKRMTPGGPPIFGAEEVVAELGSEHAETAPVLSDDLLTIYFTTNRKDPTGDPDGDIWVAYRDTPTATFGTPVEVTQLARPGLDIPTWLSPDNCRLFITTKPNGPLAIYVATRTPR